MNETPQAEYRPPTWLSALLRLWILRPAKTAPSGNATHATLIMGAIWLVLWVGVDRWQSEPDPQFSAGGIPSLAWYALAILGLAALMHRRVRTAGFDAVLTVAMGAVPVPLLFLGVGAIL